MRRPCQRIGRATSKAKLRVALPNAKRQMFSRTSDIPSEATSSVIEPRSRNREKTSTSAEHGDRRHSDRRGALPATASGIPSRLLATQAAYAPSVSIEPIAKFGNFRMPKSSVSANAGSASSRPVTKPLRTSCAIICSPPLARRTDRRDRRSRCPPPVPAGVCDRPPAPRTSSAMRSAAATFCSTSKTVTPALAHPRHRLHGFADEFRRQPRRWLVEQQHFGIGEQRAGKGQHLPLAAG